MGDVISYDSVCLGAVSTSLRGEKVQVALGAGLGQLTSAFGQIRDFRNSDAFSSKAFFCQTGIFWGGTS